MISDLENNDLPDELAYHLAGLPFEPVDHAAARYAANLAKAWGKPAEPILAALTALETARARYHRQMDGDIKELKRSTFADIIDVTLHRTRAGIEERGKKVDAAKQELGQLKNAAKTICTAVNADMDEGQYFGAYSPVAGQDDAANVIEGIPHALSHLIRVKESELAAMATVRSDAKHAALLVQELIEHLPEELLMYDVKAGNPGGRYKKRDTLRYARQELRTAIRKLLQSVTGDAVTPKQFNKWLKAK